MRDEIGLSRMAPPKHWQVQCGFARVPLLSGMDCISLQAFCQSDGRRCSARRACSPPGRGPNRSGVVEWVRGRRDPLQRQSRPSFIRRRFFAAAAAVPLAPLPPRVHAPLPPSAVRPHHSSGRRTARVKAFVTCHLPCNLAPSEPGLGRPSSGSRASCCIIRCACCACRACRRLAAATTSPAPLPGRLDWGGILLAAAVHFSRMPAWQAWHARAPDRFTSLRLGSSRKRLASKWAWSVRHKKTQPQFGNTQKRYGGKGYVGRALKRVACLGRKAVAGLGPVAGPASAACWPCRAVPCQS